MAESTIKKPTRLGARETVTVPYTAPSDGFMLCRMKSKNVSGGNTVLTFSVATSGGAGISIYIPANGGYASGLTVIRKGEVFDEGTKTNVDSYTLRFIPLEG